MRRSSPRAVTLGRVLRHYGRGWLWRAVDDAGEVLDHVISDAHAKRFCQTLEGTATGAARLRDRSASELRSLRHAARFCSVFSTVCNTFRPGRHALSASNYRTVMRGRWLQWDFVSETTALSLPFQFRGCSYEECGDTVSPVSQYAQPSGCLTTSSQDQTQRRFPSGEARD